MTRSTKYGKRERIERARQRLEESRRKEANESQSLCCPACKLAAQRGAMLGEFLDIREGLSLTEQQARMYWAWVSELCDRYGAADEILEEVSVTFTFTPMGRAVVAHTQYINAHAEEHCTLDQGW